MDTASAAATGSASMALQRVLYMSCVCSLCLLRMWSAELMYSRHVQGAMCCTALIVHSDEDHHGFVRGLAAALSGYLFACASEAKR